MNSQKNPVEEKLEPERHIKKYMALQTLDEKLGPESQMEGPTQAL